MAINFNYLDDPDVKRWFVNLQKGSLRTAEQYYNWLATFCDYRQMTPKELIEEFKQDKKKAQDALEDFINELSLKISPTTNQPTAPKSVNLALSAIKNWYTRSECIITRVIKIQNLSSTPTIIEERIPTQDELRAILNHGGPRTRAAIALFAFAGIRPEAIAALTMLDLPELEVKEGKVIVLRFPMRINVRGELSKNKRPYFTFLIQEGIDYLVAYLETRLHSQAVSTEDHRTKIVPPENFSKSTLVISATILGKSMRRGSVSQAIRRTLRSSGFSQRPYVLRDYFATQIQNARLDFERQKFYAGHNGTIQGEYTVRKRIEGEQLEKMREEFKKFAEPCLTTVQRITIIDPKQTIQTSLVANGLTQEKANQLIEAMSSDTDWSKVTVTDIYRNASQHRIEFMSLSRDIETIRRSRKSAKSTDTAKPKIIKSTKKDPKIIEEKELQGYLDKGWTISHILPSGKIVVEN